MRPSEGRVTGSIPVVGTKYPSRTVHSGAGFSFVLRLFDGVTVRRRIYTAAHNRYLNGGFNRGVECWGPKKTPFRAQNPYYFAAETLRNPRNTALSRPFS